MSAGILFILHTGLAWEHLPEELGFGSGMTCWRRLRRWTDAGVFDKLHRVLLAELNRAGDLDWSKVMIDAGHVRSKKGAHVWGLLQSTVAVLGPSITWLATETVYRWQ